MATDMPTSGRKTSCEAGDAKLEDTRFEGIGDNWRVRAQLIDQLYKQAPVGIIATLVNSSIVVLILWDLIPHRVLLMWLGASVFVAALRYGLISMHQNGAFAHIQPEWWNVLQVAGIGASGLLWGLAGVFLFPIESTAHQAFIAFVLAGMVAGAVGTCYSVFPAFAFFSFPALLPIFFRFLLTGDELHTAMAAMTFLFLVLTFLTARHINHSATELVVLKEYFAAKVNERTNELIRANEELNREIADRKEGEDQIRLALSEKEVLLKEVHHRVKNNLAVIISILKMQSSRISDPRGKAALQDCYDRVKAMALIHETLYESEDLAAISLASYARSLSDNLMQMMLGETDRIGIQVVIQAEGVQLPIDEAMPCGLILNELLINALKYAFAGRAGGQILVKARISDCGVFELVVRDNGVGLPAQVNPRNPNTLGFRIISILVEHQMNGIWDARNEDGACITIQWPASTTRGRDDGRQA
jgi:two-component sensor histidine kinase